MKENDRKSFDTETLIGHDIEDILRAKGGQVEGGDPTFDQKKKSEERISQPQSEEPSSQKTSPEEPDIPHDTEKKTVKKPKKKKSRLYRVIMYTFAAIFILLIAYLVYFNIFLKDDILNSPYNKRQDAQAEYVIRGNIESSDGQVLATTVTDDEGNETRVYPFGRVFAHAVGYTTNGKSGLESEENYTLLTSHANIIDRIVNDLSDKKNMGDTLVTTLNADLQQAAYSALGDARGAVVAIDPETGKILTMVSKPDFDPNTLSQDWDAMVSDSSNSSLVNRVTQGKYTPGSTFKIVTSLAYLRKYGSFDGFSFECTGEITYDGYTVHCSGGEAHGQVDFRQAFARSCNCAFITMGMDLGEEALKDAAESLLFNTSLPSELNTNRGSFSLVTGDGTQALMQTSFGQGKTLATPYQMALITCAIANDGLVMKPTLIDSVKNDSGNTVWSQGAEVWKTLITENEADLLLENMKAVVTEGSGQGLAGRPYTAAGKTGTADYTKSDGSSGTYGWFTGLMEADGKKLVVTVLVEEGSGAGSAVPIAGVLFDTYYNMLMN